MQVANPKQGQQPPIGERLAIGLKVVEFHRMTTAVLIMLVLVREQNVDKTETSNSLLMCVMVPLTPGWQVWKTLTQSHRPQ